MSDQPSDLQATRLDLDEQGVAWITLNRPESANARNQRMREELGSICQFVSKTPDIRVVVLKASAITDTNLVVDESATACRGVRV